MELKEVTSELLDEYVFNSPKPHYLQTSAFGDVNSKRGIKTKYLILYDKDKAVGSCLLIEKKVLNYKTYYCPRGFILDYKDKDLIKEMTYKIKEYVKKNNGLYFKMDPDIIIRKLDKNCSPIFEDKDNLKLIEYLKDLGFKHRGFTIKFKESSMPRFTFRVDVSKDNLLESFHQTTRNILKRNNPYGLKVRIGDKNDLPLFYKIMKETAIRKHMYIEDAEYFDSFYSALHNKNMSDLYIVSVNIEDLKNKYNELINNTSKQLEDNNLSKGKLTDLNDQLVKYKKELKQIESINEKEYILSSMITAKYKDIVWTIHGANASELSFLNANYELYWNIIKDSKENGYKWVDFYGSEGSIDKHSDAFGIYNFKVRFGGDFDEFIGEFDLVTKPIANAIISKLLVLRRKIKYKLQNH